MFSSLFIYSDTVRFYSWSVIVGSLDLYQKRRDDELKNNLKRKFFIPISILVPAHNEETTIVDTVCTLLRQDYPLFEIVVIDDGSTDETAQRMIDYFQMRKIERPIRRQLRCKPETAIYEAKSNKIQLTLILKENGGKGDTLNMGINASPFPLFYLHGCLIRCSRRIRCSRLPSRCWKTIRSWPAAGRCGFPTALKWLMARLQNILCRNG